MKGTQLLKDHRIRIITGNYGTGKTEFSVNYALKLAEQGKKVALVDLDVVNLYFRSREQQEMMEKAGIRVISSSIKGKGADLPAISAEVAAPLQDESYHVILDVGGDSMGARVLVRYHQYFKENAFDMLFVVNANRPETATKEGVLQHVESIARVSKTYPTALVNNTHLLRETSMEDVKRGQKLCREVSGETGLPIRYVSLLESLANELPEDYEGEAFPIRLTMRESWM
ncbi:MAG: ATP-binding protein [Tindallia sp. MSAO_Bac2]|nr:MAG: ATP-binding protein [Tindallia sp. MSAO_Bac2]